jgi:hypothetical protein
LRQADGIEERCYLSTWRIAPFGRFWQARHPPRYAASLKPSSPRFKHSSIAFKLRLCNVCGDDTVAQALRDDFEAMGAVEQFD